MRFTSPAIDMFSDNENYLKFLKDIKGHFKESMIRIENIVENIHLEIYMYPRGIVGDSKWQFNHDISFETAVARWKRSAGRFRSRESTGNGEF